MYFLYWWNQKFWKFDLTLKVKVNRPPNNRDFKQVILHLWLKFGDPLGMSYGAESSKLDKSGFFKLNLTLKVKIDPPPMKNNGDLS